MSEIKRIRLKDDNVQIQPGDHCFYNFAADGSCGNFPVKRFGATLGEWRAQIDAKEVFVDRDLRPLAAGELIQEGDYVKTEYRNTRPVSLRLLSEGDWELGNTVDGWQKDYPESVREAYRLVRMQIEGWRYLDVGEVTPEGYEYLSEGKWVIGTCIGVPHRIDDRCRVPWPPRADKEPSCVYCSDPADETMGLVNDASDSVRCKYSHARCAQRASRLQTPKPEPLECQEQWGEEFEVWW